MTELRRASLHMFHTHLPAVQQRVVPAPPTPTPEQLQVDEDAGCGLWSVHVMLFPGETLASFLRSRAETLSMLTIACASHPAHPNWTFH